MRAKVIRAWSCVGDVLDVEYSEKLYVGGEGGRVSCSLKGIAEPLPILLLLSEIAHGH